MACDVLRGVWEDTDGADGFVSLEVEPALAHDTDATLNQARELWQEVDRPNVMIKIPGTEAGLPAIEEAIADGVNVNVTLLFSVESYEAVTESFIKGLERRHAKGESLDVHSVASFFVSRVDSEVDKRLEALDRTDLQGTAAIANAQAAYMSFKRIFQGERFAALREAGAPVQRPLWASTGVKNPAYPDTKYVDGLVAPHTVNTMPMATLLAAAENSEISGATADADPAEALAALADAGIDMGDVTKKLLEDGIAAFVTPFDQLIAGVESSKEAAVTGRPSTMESSLPDQLEEPLAKRVERAVDEDVARRVWSKDETLWGGPGPEIGDRLGWLTIGDRMLEQVDELQAFAAEVKSAGITDAALLGMGGSSLGPEVIRRSFGDHGWADPARSGLDRPRRGAGAGALAGPVEDAVHRLLEVRRHRGDALPHAPLLRAHGRRGDQFVAVTDPGSGLVDLARERGFRRVFENDPKIGGRYSVLSYFGLVPAAVAGVDVRALLESAQEAEQNCNDFDSSSSNSGLWMGMAMAELALQGRDKLTFIVSEPIASFGLWVEQLIAESTGKHGRGVLPVADEPVGAPEAYGDDRVFAYIRNEKEPDAELDAKVEALRKAGQAVLTVTTRGTPEDLGRIFFFAEFATAVAGWALEINAFDQPNVQEAKDNTNKVLEASDPPQVDDADDDGPEGAAGWRRTAELRGDHGLRGPVGGLRRRRLPSCAPRSATPPRPPRRSATGRGSCTPRASSTRGGRPRGCSCS